MVIKFLSLNLWHGALINQSIDFLREQDADIVILQEVHNAVDSTLPDRLRGLSFIQEELSYHDRDFAPGLLFNHPEGKIPNGNAILSKFPIINRSLTFFREKFNDNYVDSPENFVTYPRTLQHAVLRTPVGEINVFNLHGVWDLDGDNYSGRRREMSEIIVEAIKDKPRVLLGGDTNAKPTNQAILNIEKHLTSVFGNELKTTFNMRRKDNPGYATAAVDMLFVSKGIKILSRESPAVDISDHLPVLAVLDVA